MFQQAFMRRRRFLGISALGGVATVLGGLPRSLLAADRPRPSKAKNVLLIFEQGGISHIDTWDPKPDVTDIHRSPFKPIATRVPGMRFTELLPHTARIADKLAVVRSMHHNAGDHGNGSYYVLCGSNPFSPQRMPNIGSIVAHLQGSSCKYLPPYIMVPGNNGVITDVTGTAFLPGSLRVFRTGGQNVSDPNWKVNALLPREENTGERFAGRQHLRAALNGAKVDGGPTDAFYHQAYEMLASNRVSAAFDWRKEPPAVRDKYGRGHRGACYLVGRKLIEAGVRFVTVDGTWPLTAETPGSRDNLDWDHHDAIYAKGLCRPIGGGGGEGRYGIGHYCMSGSTDQAFAALIEDLDLRGLLSETLVCFVTEFGRTPRVDAKTGGRDHWTNAYSIVFAGAGVPGGQVIGRTDREGGYPADEPHTPEDYAATIYEKLGIDRTQPLYTPNRRPVYFGHEGKPIAAMF
jgi:hypothetical protein